MSKKGMAVLAVVLLVLVIVGALMGGVKAGTPMFQAVGAVLLVVALVMFFMKKKDICRQRNIFLMKSRRIL